MGARIGGLFEPDILNSHLYWRNFRCDASPAPEKRLMLAVLEDAIACLRKHRVTGDARFSEARKWILEKSPERPFSFEFVCAALGLSASYLRAGLIPSREQTRATRQQTGQAAFKLTRNSPIG